MIVSLDKFLWKKFEELIQELIKAKITEARLKKRLRGEGGWYGNSVRQQDYQVIMELSGEIPVKLLCRTMGIQRSSFHAWKKHLSHPSDREKSLASNVLLFQEYHLKYPSHGYRWLNAKIRMDTGKASQGGGWWLHSLFQRAATDLFLGITWRRSSTGNVMRPSVEPIHMIVGMICLTISRWCQKI